MRHGSSLTNDTDVVRTEPFLRPKPSAGFRILRREFVIYISQSRTKLIKALYRRILMFGNQGKDSRGLAVGVQSLIRLSTDYVSLPRGTYWLDRSSPYHTLGRPMTTWLKALRKLQLRSSLRRNPTSCTNPISVALTWPRMMDSNAHAYGRQARQSRLFWSISDSGLNEL